MAHTCNKCSRVSPDDAQYCYWDGIALAGAGGQGGPVSIGSKPFSAPFTFPSGKTCQNFDQLAMGCVQNWSDALSMLKQGYIEKFLAGQGRGDLAMAAREAAKFPDKDRGLDQFLDKLPSQAAQSAQLQVDPRDFELGTLKVGADKKLEIKLRNAGMRLLYGNITCDANWVSIGSPTGGQKKLFQFGSELTIPLHISGKRLRASNKPLEAKLTIDSNGGVVDIPIRAKVPVKPYPDGVLAGSTSPRQVAEKAKANPKDSAILFERGTVAQWYKDNGWIYPVRGPSASGMGAIQQFFEALGLTAPPKVQINQQSVTLNAQPGQRLEHMLEVRTEEKRPVFAHGVSDQPWVEVGRAKLNGRAAAVPLVINSVPNRPGETITAKVAVTSNGGKKFIVPITLRIGGAFDIIGAPAAAAGGAAPMIAPPMRYRPVKSGGPIHLLPALLLLMVLGGLVIRDLLQKGGVIIPPPESVTQTNPDGTLAPLVLKDYEPRVSVDFFKQGKSDEKDRFGISLPKVEDPNYQGAKKRLFYDPFGAGNNTRIDLNGYQFIFGNKYANAMYQKDPKTKVVLRDFDISSTLRKPMRGWLSKIKYQAETSSVEVTQEIRIVPGDANALLDTVLVRYTVENIGGSGCTVGFRTMLDTYIGGNDGVPVFVPAVEGHPEHLVTTKEVLKFKEIPDFVQVYESDNLSDPKNTNAVMGLRIGGCEEPAKFVICRWPGESGGGGEAAWGNEEPKTGDWSYVAMNDPPDKPKDSCMVIYWEKRNMQPKEKRVFGYTYGLGKIADPGDGPPPEPGGRQLSLQVVKALHNQEFPIIATIVKGQQDQKVTLKLPAGLKLAPGQSLEKTTDASERATITWKVIGPKGEYKVEADAPGIGTAKATIKVKLESDSIFGSGG